MVASLFCNVGSLESQVLLHSGFFPSRCYGIIRTMGVFQVAYKKLIVKSPVVVYDISRALAADKCPSSKFLS